jgi:hypothetical protein
MPFAPDCQRQENGMITAGAGAGAGPNNAGSGNIARDCAGQLSSKVMTSIDRIENRRVFAADPATCNLKTCKPFSEMGLQKMWIRSFSSGVRRCAGFPIANGNNP